MRKTLTSTDVYKKLKHSCSKHLIDMPSPETRAGKTSLILLHHAFVKLPFRTLGWLACDILSGSVISCLFALPGMQVKLGVQVEPVTCLAESRQMWHT